MSPAQSPYEAVLGDRFGLLHPRLRAYFSVIPVGHVGVGEGVFALVGTPRRWLHPFIRLLVAPDVLFPVWEQDVAFTVTNSPAGGALRPAVAAVRTFHFVDGSRLMRDLIVATPDGLADILGAKRRFRALFGVRIFEGELRLDSIRVALRIGRRHIFVPRLLAPVVSLAERFSDCDDRQYIVLTVTMPLLGRVYEYAGSFRYHVKAGSA